MKIIKRAIPSNTVVSVKNQAEARSLLMILRNDGYRWMITMAEIPNEFEWNSALTQVYYRIISASKEVVICMPDVAEDCGDTVIAFDDFMKRHVDCTRYAKLVLAKSLRLVNQMVKARAEIGATMAKIKSETAIMQESFIKMHEAIDIMSETISKTNRSRDEVDRAMAKIIKIINKIKKIES